MGADKPPGVKLNLALLVASQPDHDPGRDPHQDDRDRGRHRTPNSARLLHIPDVTRRPGMHNLRQHNDWSRFHRLVLVLLSAWITGRIVRAGERQPKVTRDKAAKPANNLKVTMSNDTKRSEEVPPRLSVECQDTRPDLAGLGVAHASACRCRLQPAVPFGKTLPSVIQSKLTPLSPTSDVCSGSKEVFPCMPFFKPAENSSGSLRAT